MVEFVAADASFSDRGAVQFNVGVLIEISGGRRFDEHYQMVVNEFTTEHDIELAHKILKTDDILERVPSFNIRDASGDIVESLLENPAIERVYALIGWYDEKVRLPWKGESIEGIKFSIHIYHKLFLYSPSGNTGNIMTTRVKRCPTMPG